MFFSVNLSRKARNMFTIENQFVKAVIQAKGAELVSFINKSNGMEYMWSGDPAVWGKHSPVLFPIVGGLKNNTYFYDGKPYELPRHGFARDRVFSLQEQTADTVTFLLRDDEESHRVYPFSFELRMRYSLYENSLSVTYEVINTNPGEMYFSLGAHPAFKVPLENGLTYNDYYLQFEKVESAPRWPISDDGLIENISQPFLNNSDHFALSKELFQRDAVVFKNLVSSAVTLKSDKGERGLKMDFPGFPFLGIWAAKNADFVCIEPWCGIADSVGANQQLAEKEGINKLAPKDTFTRTWTVELF